MYFTKSPQTSGKLTISLEIPARQILEESLQGLLPRQVVHSSFEPVPVQLSVQGQLKLFPQPGVSPPPGCGPWLGEGGLDLRTEQLAQTNLTVLSSSQLQPQLASPQVLDDIQVSLPSLLLQLRGHSLEVERSQTEGTVRGDPGHRAGLGQVQTAMDDSSGKKSLLGFLKNLSGWYF